MAQGGAVVLGRRGIGLKYGPGELTYRSECVGRGRTGWVQGHWED